MFVSSVRLTSAETDKAKALEIAGWAYPQHLAGRAYGLIVHGDVAGIEGSRRGLCDWLDWIGFIDARHRCALIDTSATSNPTRLATMRSMRRSQCKKKRAMWDVQLPRQ